ncbi:hypothetical protein OIU84_012812 [Salix udensis]|uniref:Uncharacterized protein n=1 Tax=Salix udensis TaxID=889485 RepID=A0AAD6JGH1_9ROSI|nr:hypothetical protein OIU84_012812 [Salix udensis]
MTKERIGKLLKAVANVLGSKKDQSDTCLVLGLSIKVSTFVDMEGEETFESSLLGYADEVAEERIAAADVIMIRGTETTSAVSLILRGANDYMLDELERALHESNMVVAGGGAVESALSVYLEYLATTLGSREQSAIAEFAESLLVIPKVIAYMMSSAITILRIDDMIKPVKDESQNADRGL